MPSEEERRVEIHLSPAQAEEFVNRLTEDDDFRRRVEEEPIETLAEYGIHVPPDVLTDQVGLPSKDEMAELRDRLASSEFDEEAYFGPLARKYGLIIWWVRKLMPLPPGSAPPESP